MVECPAVHTSAGVMPRIPWLLLNLMGILVLVTSCSLAIAENKLADVNGEDGVIDQVEAYLLARGLQQKEQQQYHRQQLQQPTRDAQLLQQPKHEDNPPLQAEKIEFGVGPSDPRYFAGKDEAVDAPEIASINRRSGPSSNSLYDHIRNSYNPVRDNLLYDDLPNRYDDDDNLSLYAPNNPGYNPSYDVSNGYGADDSGNDVYSNNGYGRRPPSGRYGNLYGQRPAVVDGRGGDVDASRRMLGGLNNAFRADRPGKMASRTATSQPESVHYLHHKQIQRDPLPSSSQNQQHKQAPSSDTTLDYNPNDPSSNINIDTELAKNRTSGISGDPSSNNADGATIGGQVLAGIPQHLSQSHHSAALGHSAVVSEANPSGFSDVYFTAMVAGCTAAAVCAIIGTGVCWYKLNKNQRAAKDADYPAYGVTGPSRELSPGSGSGGGDRTLAHSAHMYHYQQQKNQMIAIDKSGVGERDVSGPGGASDVDSEEDEGEDKDYTVYECPGLAPMGEMVVPNPMYTSEDGGGTPASPTLKGDELDHQQGKELK